MLKKFILNKLTQYDSKVLEYELFNPLTCQFLVMRKILAQAKYSQFAQKYKIDEIETLQDFAQAIPLHDYQMLSSYYEKIGNGDKNVLFQGSPDYFVYSSGSTGNRKYFPISKNYLHELNHHGRKMVLNFHKNNLDPKIIAGKTLSLSGSTKLMEFAKKPAGLMSAINLHSSPWYLKKQKLPPLAISDLEDFNLKLEKLCDYLIQTKPDLRQMIALPTWSYLFFEKFEQKSGKKFYEFFPNFSLFLSGGVNLGPHLERIKNYCGKNSFALDNYIASEGMFATQFSPREDLSLNCNLGTYFEFIEMESRKRVQLSQVELKKKYELVVSTVNGLWAYQVGDIIEFTCLHPFRLKVVGRTQQFINLATEKFYESDAEVVINKLQLPILEYTASPSNDLRENYLWILEGEFTGNGLDIKIDELMRAINSTYDHLRKANALKAPEVLVVAKGKFVEAMNKINRLGGQNKIPRVANETKFSELVCKK